MIDLIVIMIFDSHDTKQREYIEEFAMIELWRAPPR